MALRWRPTPDLIINAATKSDAIASARSYPVEIGEDVLEAAFHVQALALGLGEDPGSEKVHDDPERRDDRHEPPRNDRRTDQARDRLVADEHGEHQQHRAVGLPAEHLGPAHAIGQMLARRPLHDPDHHQRQHQRAGVGQHVAGIRDQRERVRQDADDDFEDHVADDEQKRDRQIASIGIGADCMRMVAARVIPMTVAMMIIVVVAMAAGFGGVRHTLSGFYARLDRGDAGTLH